MHFTAHQGLIVVTHENQHLDTLTPAQGTAAAMRLLTETDKANGYREALRGEIPDPHPPSARTVQCRKCHTEWTTRVIPGNNATCPECKTRRRISTTGMDDH